LTSTSHTLARPAPLPSRYVGAIWSVLGFVTLTACLVPVLSSRFSLLFLVAGLAVVGILLLIGHPHWGILLILSLWFSGFSPAFLDAEFLRIPYLIAAVLLVPLVLRVAHERHLRALEFQEVRIVAAIGVLFLLSTWWAEFDHPNLLLPELDRSRLQLIRFGSRFVFLIYFAVFMVDRKRIEWTVWTILLLVFVAAATSWTKVFGGEGVDRAGATFGFAANSNRLAFVCLFAAAIIWFYRSDGPPGRARRVLWPLLFFFPLTALATGSRGGMLQLLALVAVILRGQRAASAARRVQSLVVIASAAVVLLVTVPQSLLQRTVSYEARRNAPGSKSLQNRIWQLESATELFVAHPLIGIGPGNYDWMSLASSGPGDTAHNSYLLALTEGGVVVFALYLALFAALFRSLRRIEREGPEDLRWLGKALRTGLVLFLIASATGDIWLEDPIYWILALSIAANALSFPALPSPAWNDRASSRPVRS
jgi:O-antigen ligase